MPPLFFFFKNPSFPTKLAIIFKQGGTKCIKNQPCDVIKMRKMRGEVGNKTPKKSWIIPHFYDITWLIFETLSPVTRSMNNIG